MPDRLPGLSWCRSLAVAVFLLPPISVLCPLPSHAQSGEGAANSDVEPLVQEGIELRQAGNDEAALTIFLRALEENPDSVRIQAHVALAAQATGRWLEADRYLREVFRHAQDPYVKRHRDALNRAQEIVDARIGSLSIEGSPDGAEVRLNGRVIGTLPFTEPARVLAGSYTLEVVADGYFSETRSLVIEGGMNAREHFELNKGTKRDIQAAAQESAGAQDTPGLSRGVKWGIAMSSLSVAALSGALVAYFVRENRAERWNDDSRCLAPGRTRGDVCGDERDGAERAERAAIASMALAGAFAAAAIVSFTVGKNDKERAEGQATSCGVGLGQVSCRGHF